MEDAVLSPEESQALMDALREGDNPREGAAVVEIDLVGGERPLRGAQPAVEKLGAPLAATLRRTLAATYRISCDVSAEATEIIPFGEVRRRIEDGTVVGRIESLPSGAPMLLMLGPEFVAAVTDFGFGGNGESTPPLTDREPTALERNLLRRLSMLLTADVENVWRREADVDLSFLRIEGSNDIGSLLGDGTPLLLAPFKISFNQATDQLMLALSAGSVDMLARAQARDVVPATRTVDQELWEEHLRKWPTRLSADLGRCHLTIGEVLALEEGSVLRLDAMASEPISVLVNDVVKLKAQPVISNGSMALRVERWAEDEEDEENESTNGRGEGHGQPSAA